MPGAFSKSLPDLRCAQRRSEQLAPRFGPDGPRPCENPPGRRNPACKACSVRVRALRRSDSRFRRSDRTYTQISWGPASRSARNLDNRARQGDSDRKAGLRAARTSVMMMEVHAAEESSARLAARPLGRKWKARLSVSCDKKSGAAQDVPFLGPGSGTEITL